MVPPAVPLPTAEEEAADILTGGYKRYLTKSKLQARQARIDKMESDKTPCFAFIMKTVSDESKEGVAKLDNYDADIKNSRDPSVLLEAFELTHSTRFSPNATIMMLNVEDQYAGLKQNNNESLLLYKRRIEHTLCMYDAIGVTRPADAIVVNNMIKTVHQGKYGDAIQQLLMAVREDVKTFPATTQELYIYLMGRVPDAKAYNRQDHVIDSAFVTTDSSKQTKKSGGKKYDEKVKQPTRECKICPSFVPPEEKKHWQTDCPYLERFHQAMVKEEKSKDLKVKKQLTFATTECTDGQGGDDSEDSDSAWVTMSETVAAAVANGHLGPRDVLFDCAATVSIVNNAELLTNISKLNIPRIVTGVGGNATITRYGELPVIGRVLYSPNFPVSVLSQSKVMKHIELDLDYVKICNKFIVSNTKTGAVLTFAPKRGLYVCAFPIITDDLPLLGEDNDSEDDEDEPSPRIYTTTAERNKLLYTKREVDAADKARQLVQSLAYPSMSDMFAMIKAGISGSSVTSRDLHRALSIYGPFVPSIQGKTTRKKTQLVVDDVPKSLITKQVLHADLMFVDQIPILVSVSQPLGLTIASHLRTGKGVASMRKAMSHHIHQYHAQGFQIKSLVFDGEGAIGAIADDIGALGTQLERVPPGAHVVVVERKIRLIKERFRAIKAGL